MEPTDFYQDILDEAKEFLDDPANSPDYYPESTVAGIDPNQYASLEAQKEWATGQGQEQVDNYINYINSGAAGEYDLTPEEYQINEYLNPYQQEVIDTASKQAVSATNAGFGGTGTLGGARSAAASGQAAFNAAQPHLQRAYDTQWNHENQVNNANVGLRNTYDVDNLNRRTGFNNQVGTSYNVGLQPAHTLGAVGDFYRGYNQDVINEDIKRHNYYEQLPGQLIQQKVALGAAEQAGASGNTTGNGSDLFSDLFGGEGLDLGTFVGDTAGSFISDAFKDIFG